MIKAIFIVLFILVANLSHCQRLEDNYIKQGEIHDSLLIKCVKCIYLLKDADSIVHIQQDEIDTYERILENKEYQIKLLNDNNNNFKRLYEIERDNKPLFNNLTYISIAINLILLTIIIF